MEAELVALLGGEGGGEGGGDEGAAAWQVGWARWLDGRILLSRQFPPNFFRVLCSISFHPSLPPLVPLSLPPRPHSLTCPRRAPGSACPDHA